MESKDEDLLRILATKINLANTINENQFIYYIQFDIEELETYLQAIQDPNVAKWAEVIEKKLNQLCKNKTWKLIYKSEIELSY